MNIRQAKGWEAEHKVKVNQTEERVYYLPALSSAWTSEKITKTTPAKQTSAPIIFLNLYFVFKKSQVRNITHGIVQQSNSMTLVIDVYW